MVLGIPEKTSEGSNGTGGDAVWVAACCANSNDAMYKKPTCIKGQLLCKVGAVFLLVSLIFLSFVPRMK